MMRQYRSPRWQYRGSRVMAGTAPRPNGSAARANEYRPLPSYQHMTLLFCRPHAAAPLGLVPVFNFWYRHEAHDRAGLM